MSRSQKRKANPNYPQINETHPEGNRHYRRSFKKIRAAEITAQSKIALRRARTTASKKSGDSLQTYLRKFYNAIGLAK